MRVVCPSCDREPAAGARAGSACAGCGARLVQVSDDADLVGTVLDDRFELVAVLGRGGMGTVFRATQRSIGRDVAVKMMDRRLARDVDSVKRFMREAKLASQLAHPNTVGVIDFGQSSDGQLYLAMELVRGKTLHDLLQTSGALPVARVVRIGVQLCDALEAAHALGIVHRDLKLENVMLLEGDRDAVKILDFGLARSLIDPSSRATATGIIAGTPRYLPPEVASGGADPAPAQDMYSLGVVLGELASGTVLWKAPTVEALFAAKTRRSPVLDTIAPELAALVERLIATDPQQRPTAAAARADLLAVADKPPRASRRAESPVAVDPTALPVGSAARQAQVLAREATSMLAVEVSAPDIVPPSAAFVPPPPPDERLELESEWQREKRAKQDAANARPAPPRARPGTIVVAIAVIAAAGAGVWYATSRPSSAPPQPSSGPTLPATPHTVSIQIRAPSNARVEVDHIYIGNGSRSYTAARSRRAVVIDATLDDRTDTRQVVPDRDQLVELLGP